MTSTDGSRTDRRTVLTVVGGGLVVGLAGCLGNGDNEVPAAVRLDDSQACDQCGMVIEQHPGPTGQIFFDDHPPDRDGPAWFCSATCTYSYRFDHENDGETPIITYLTDYSVVDYSVDDGDEPSISAHLEAADYHEEANLSVVIGSDVIGAMGSDLIPFSDVSDAEAFIVEYGGDVQPAIDVNRELVDSMRT